jgi:hypothetical protein
MLLRALGVFKFLLFYDHLVDGVLTPVLTATCNNSELGLALVPRGIIQEPFIKLL